MAVKNKTGAPVLPTDADPSDPNDPRHKRKSHIPANEKGSAYPERIAWLRETFPRMAWTEAYDTQGRPDRHGEITLRDIADLRAQGSLFEYEAFMLDLKREFHLVRWRVWLDAKIGAKGDRNGLTVKNIEHRKAQREANAARREAKSVKGAPEWQAKKDEATRKRLAALKARKKADPNYGIPTKVKPGRVKGKWRGPEEGRHKTGRKKAEYRNPAFKDL